MTRVQSAVLSVVVILATALVSARSGQQLVFRAGVPTVSIYATVVDSTGRLVPSLEQDDFEVFDNGKRQDLTVFANDVQPITLVMMLDRSQSMEQNFTLVRDAAEHFVTNLLPADKVRLGSFSDRIQLDPPAFTSDKEELIRILRNNLQDAGATPLWNATAVAMTALGREEGRRVVLLFTDGHDGPDFTTRETNVSLSRVRERAAAEGIMVYAIGVANSCESKSKTPGLQAPWTPTSIRPSGLLDSWTPTRVANPGPRTLDSGLWTLDPGPWTTTPPRWPRRGSSSRSRRRRKRRSADSWSTGPRLADSARARAVRSSAARRRSRQAHGAQGWCVH